MKIVRFLIRIIEIIILIYILYILYNLIINGHFGSITESIIDWVYDLF